VRCGAVQYCAVMRCIMLHGALLPLLPRTMLSDAVLLCCAVLCRAVPHLVLLYCAAPCFALRCSAV
jgi:hypothetical protein